MNKFERWICYKDKVFNWKTIQCIQYFKRKGEHQPAAIGVQGWEKNDNGLYADTDDWLIWAPHKNDFVVQLSYEVIKRWVMGDSRYFFDLDEFMYREHQTHIEHEEKERARDRELNKLYSVKNNGCSRK